MEKSITVITPTYNRAYILNTVYDSLKNQTSKDFIWLIIDDGSEDNTREIVQNWINEKIIEIEYIKKENGGKASALNCALDVLKTKYAVCLDSDDYFLPDAIKSAINIMESIKHDASCCGVISLRVSPDMNVLGGQKIPEKKPYITAADVFEDYSLHTELCCFYKSELLKQFRFPEIIGEKFISPAWMQYKITEKTKFLVSQEKYCVCSYIDDGLTKNKRKVILKNPKGYTCVKRLSFENSHKLIPLIKHGIMFGYGSLLSHDNNYIKTSPHKILSVILFPISFFLYKTRK